MTTREDQTKLPGTEEAKDDNDVVERLRIILNIVRNLEGTLDKVAEDIAEIHDAVSCQQDHAGYEHDCGYLSDPED